MSQYVIAIVALAQRSASDEGRDRDRPDRDLVWRLYHRDSGIQNGGVIRMSGMSNMIRIVLYREAFSHNEPK